MQVPLQVVFRHMQPSASVEAKIRERADELEQFFRPITSCCVTVEAQHKHHHQGNLFHVRVDLRVPDAELVASRHPDEHHAHEDVYVAVRDAFDAIRRQLEDYSRRRRADVKRHEELPQGRVVDVQPDHGTIETDDGRSIYFHRNSVVDANYDALDVGARVRFVEEAGDEGPQARTVHVVRKPAR